MLTALLLILLFGGPGLLVAKALFVVLLVTLLVGLLFDGFAVRGRQGHHSDAA